MKMFLMTSIVAMLTAGIFGAVDLAKDLNNGTMIEYNDEAAPSDVIEAESFYIDESEFSRGEPGPPPVMEEQAVVDGATKEEVVAEVPVKTLTEGKKAEIKRAVLKKQAEETKGVKEEKLISPKLFSRGRPPKLSKEVLTIEEVEKTEELVAVQVDSAKTN